MDLGDGLVIGGVITLFAAACSGGWGAGTGDLRWMLAMGALFAMGMAAIFWATALAG